MADFVIIWVLKFPKVWHVH